VPLSADNFVQENWGAVSAASADVSPSLPSGTTAGNTLLVIINTDELSSGITPPTTAWTKDTPPTFDHNSFTGFYFAHRSNVPAGETSWTFTPSSGTRQWAWYVAEISGLDPAQPVDAAVGTDNTTSISSGSSPTRSTGNTPANPGLSTMAVAAFASTSAATGVAPGTWDTYVSSTNVFVEAAETATTSTGSVVNRGLAVARAFYDGVVGPFECTATYTAGPGAGQNAYAGMILLRAADSPVVSPLTWFYGFGNGTHFGLGSSIIGSSPLVSGITGTVGTDLIVGTGSARPGSGAYGCRIVQAGAAKFIACGTAQFGAGQAGIVAGWPLRPQSSTGVTVLAEFAPAVGTIAQVVYDPSASKVGVRWGSGGTVSYQSGTTVAGTDYPWLTLRVSGLTGATWHLDWSIEESGVLTGQSSPADLTGQTASSLAQIRWGGNVAQTVTQDVTDLCLSGFYGAYPLPAHRTMILKVDPAATPTSAATTIGDFALLTANVTGAALTSGTLTTARDNIDELPPTISASSDGILQTAVDTGYIEFPMQTYTATATEVIVAVRMLAALVSTTGAGAGALGIRGWDGSAETVLMPTSFTSTPGSSTTVGNSIPPWVGYMWNPSNGWTQAKLDAAALRFGFSNDATPDMGVHAMYLEVAVTDAKTQQLFGDLASVAVNPNSLGVVSVTVTPPSGGDSTLHYETSGSPTDVAVTAGSTATQQLNAPDKPTTNYIALYPPPEGVADT